jgi:arginase
LAVSSTLNRQIAILEAPSNLGLRPPAPGREPGVSKLAAALRAHGILARLGAVDAGRVPAPAYDPAADPATRFRNGPALRAYAIKLAAQTGAVLEHGYFPLVLGGDCSILLGNMPALKRRGRYGLVFLDGHLDFAYHRTSPVLAAAGLDLALVTGHGPDQLTNIGAGKPYVREEDVAILGYRDEEYPPEYDLQPFLDSRMRRYDLDQVRRLGVRAATERALAAIIRNGIEGFWIHLDVDVLDPLIMPAVDSPEPPGGLTYPELIELLGILLRSPYAAGMEITVFDPELDPDGHLAEELTAAIVRALGKDTAPLSG